MEMFGHDFTVPEDIPTLKEEAVKVDPTKIVSKKGKVAAKSTGLRHQFRIMEQIGVPREDIHKFADPLHWLTYFPPSAAVSLGSGM
jgi:leucyl-tRNA synthetase